MFRLAVQGYFFVTFAPEDASLVGTGSAGIFDPHLSAAALI
jgi:hypothetical protein